MTEPWRELLEYPNPPGLHPVEAAWRDHCRELLGDVHAMQDEIEQLKIKLKMLPSEGAWGEAARMLREADRARRKAEHALRFYADPRRYQGANQPSPGNDPYTPTGFPYLIDSHRDSGAIARAALEP